jgi:KDO2-lipid IV(A) lauroyltransferase
LRRHTPLRDALEYCAALLILKSLELAPPGLARLFAGRYARLLDVAVPRLRRVALKNLQMALPGVNAEQRNRIADGVFESIARLMLAFARLPRIDKTNVSAWIRYEGFEHFEAAMRQGRGVLFATAHLGNWELSAFAHALMTAPMSVVIRPLDNRWIDALVERRRTLSGNRIIEKKDAARGILRALAANEAVGILIDQNSSLEEGVFVDFFGVPACSSAGFAKLAAHSGAAVIPGCALWSETENRYVLRFYPPVEMTGDVFTDTQRLQKQIETVIREYPDQWLWIHRRWKTRPPGAPPLY